MNEKEKKKVKGHQEVVKTIEKDIYPIINEQWKKIIEEEISNGRLDEDFFKRNKIHSKLSLEIVNGELKINYSYAGMNLDDKLSFKTVENPSLIGDKKFINKYRKGGK